MAGLPTPSPSPGDTFQQVVNRIVHHLPPWLAPFVVAIITWLLLPQQVVGGLRWLVAWMHRRRPHGDKRRAAQRARFASAMATQVARVSELEEWRDERFAEMDAEVEVHARQREGWLRRPQRETIRRVPSLSVALEESTDHIILLEGEPGSGKSVALRHVALRLASEVKEHPSEHGVIPLYLNLKEFRPVGPVDADSVLTFVRASINRANDRYVESFLEQEFDRGIDEGTWMFLFDSFDEIPAVLGAVEADDIIERYANALYDFLSGMNACRGIIATREFRGPKRISWPRFRVLRLTGKQRKDLIERLDLPRAVEQRILSGIATADAAIRQLAENPLFLALLCEYQRDMKEFPQSSHIVFENYVAKRFHDDRERLMRRFKLTSQMVRVMAEQAAYCMAAQPGLGLSPARPVLLAGIQQAGFDVGVNPTAALDALEYLRLARAAESADGKTNGFTFAHRRFQEYFATCLVMREKSRTDPLSLLTDGRWRETAVTLFQTQDRAEIRPLLEQARQLLSRMTAQLGSSNGEIAIEADISAMGGSADLNRKVAATPFDWPPGSLHLLGLLQDGLPSGDPRRSEEVEILAGKLLRVAYSDGQLHDRRWAVEVCLAADPETAWDLVRRAFASGSGWLREAAYTQAGQLDQVPDDVRQEMRGVLAELAAEGRLRQQRLAIEAQLQRLPDPRPELLLERLLLIAPLVDASLWGALYCTLIVIGGANLGSARLSPLGFILIGYATFYLDRGSRRKDLEGRPSGGFAWLYAAVGTIAGEISPQFLSGAALFIRGLVAAILIVVFAGKPPFEIVFAVVAVFAISWGPAANRADRLLNKPNILAMIALPFVWLRQTAHLITPTFLRRISVIAPSGILIAILSIVFIKFVNIPTDVAVGLGVAFYGTALIVMVLAMLRNMNRRWNDHRLLAGIGRGTVPYTGFAEMLQVVSMFGTRRALLLFVQDIKRRRLPVEHPPAMRALQAFVAMVQDDSHFSHKKVFPANSAESLPVTVAWLEPNELEELHRWVDSVRSNKRTLAVTQATLDEIGKMVADVELARLAALPISINTPAVEPEPVKLDSHSRDDLHITTKLAETADEGDGLAAL
jgi:hypothetical protein